ncbi:OmpA family protein [Psychrobacter sp. DAB_AL32B]|nr:OmpA family protein [Psychrobacter sp. DAB_AL32B]
MYNINTATEDDFKELGISKSDAEAIIRHREKEGLIQIFQDLNHIKLADETKKIIGTLVKSEQLIFSTEDIEGYYISWFFSPLLDDFPPIFLTVSATDANGARHKNTGTVFANQTTKLQSWNVDLKKPIKATTVTAEGKLIEERTYQPDEIAYRRDGSVFHATIAIDLMKMILEENQRFVRSGRYSIPGNPQQRFDGYRLSVAPVTSNHKTNIVQLLRITAETLVNSAVQILPSTDIAQQLASFPLSEAEFEFEGHFLIEQPFPDNTEYVGWVWLLSGPALFFGFQADTELRSTKHNITILLPVFELLSVESSSIPIDVNEKALLDRPDIFSDDPGSTCKPFNNPGRIVSERRFSTVLRVTDPEISSSNLKEEPHTRAEVTNKNPIEWEGEADDIQPRSVARGHIVEFAVRYRSNGYSLGDVLHSLTLAPRQTRRIVKVDFKRREQASRREQTFASDEVEQATLQDRTYSNAVQSSLSEWAKGGSESSITAGAAGAGAVIGPVVLGGGVAHSNASSSSWQNGGRSVAASEQQNLKDAIRQYGDSLRSMESTIVTEAEQHEAVEGVSEVVRNINYCHALSVVYYQILRHMRVDTEVAAVRECLFVPFTVKDFTLDRVYRHRNVLRRYAGSLEFRSVFEKIDQVKKLVELRELRATLPQSNQILLKIQNLEQTISIPPGIRADQEVTSLRGSIYMKLGITRPAEGDVADEVEEGAISEVSQTQRFKEMVKQFSIFSVFTSRSPSQIVHDLLGLDEQARDRYFQREVAPYMAREFANRLQLGIIRDGKFFPIDADFTLAGSYNYGNIIRIDFVVGAPVEPQIRVGGIGRVTNAQINYSGPPLTRSNLVNLTLKAPTLDDSNIALPKRSFADVTRGTLSFTTEHYQRTVDSPGHQINDLLHSETGSPDPQGAILTFPLSAYEMEDTRKELIKAYQQLLEELNSDKFKYHKAIWWNMDRDQLYTLLDAFSTSTSEGNSRSIAGIVERSPIGILGNSLVFRVSAGAHLDPNLKTSQQLLSYYKDSNTVAEPMRISLPTSGLYARAHMDECNACEEHAGTREWVLTNKEPELQDIDPSLLASRRSDPTGLAPSAMPETLINLQNAPAIPDPSGVGSILSAVSKADAFRDMAGLAGTQQNALEGLKTAASLASNFGSMAFQMKLAELESDKNAARDIAATAAAIQSAKDKGLVSDENAQKSMDNLIAKRTEKAGKERSEEAANRAKNLMLGDRAGSVTEADGSGATVTEVKERKKEINPQTDQYVIPLTENKVLFLGFDVGEWDLKKQHRHALEIIATQLLNQDSLARSEGHASTSGSEEDNEVLSENRAQSLFEALRGFAFPLLEQYINKPETITYQGELGNLRNEYPNNEYIKRVPGAGHRNDPVQRSVVLNFTHPVDPKKVWETYSLFSFSIKITGRVIDIGSYYVVNRGGDFVVINKETQTVTHIETGKNITLQKNTDNSQVTVTQINNGGINLNINGDNSGTINITVPTTENGSFVPLPNPNTKQWKLIFSKPKFTDKISLADLLKQLSQLIVDAGGVNANSDPTLLNQVNSMVSSGVDAVLSEIKDFLVGRVGNIALQALQLIVYGHMTVETTIKIGTSSTVEKSGTLSGPALLVGGTPSENATFLNNAEYITAQAQDLEAWDDTSGFKHLVYVDNPGQALGGSAVEMVRTLVNEVQTLLPESLVPSTLMDETERVFALLSIAAVKLSLSSRVEFQAGADDLLTEWKGDEVKSSGVNLGALVFAPGQISFKF